MTINHLGISGGKDSTALLLWAVHESGYDPASLDVTFCDTGNEDERTLVFVEMLSQKVFPVTTIRPPLDFYALAESKSRFPDPLRRFCTVELKLKPTQAHIAGLWERGHDVLLHTGIRASESPERAALSEYGWEEYFACDVYRPLLRWTIKDVWAIHERYGIPRNPLYDLGAKRVGCYPCIMSQKSELLNIARHMPERVAFLATKEAELNTNRKREGSFAPFFPLKKVPVVQRSRKFTTKAGAERTAATVEDVFRWARTSRGGSQYMLDYDFEEPPTCSSRSGLCE